MFTNIANQDKSVHHNNFGVNHIQVNTIKSNVTFSFKNCGIFIKNCGILSEIADITCI